MIVVRRPFPGAHRSVCTGPQVPLVDRFGREILVAFDDDTRVAVRNQLTGPKCLSHEISVAGWMQANRKSFAICSVALSMAARQWAKRLFATIPATFLFISAQR